MHTNTNLATVLGETTRTKIGLVTVDKICVQRLGIKNI